MNERRLHEHGLSARVPPVDTPANPLMQGLTGTARFSSFTDLACEGIVARLSHVVPVGVAVV